MAEPGGLKDENKIAELGVELSVSGASDIKEALADAIKQTKELGDASKKAAADAEAASDRAAVSVKSLTEAVKGNESAWKVTDSAVKKSAKTTADGFTVTEEKAAKTGSTFADLKSKLGEANPSATQLVATLGDLSSTAQRFFEIGQAIRSFIENSKAFNDELERMAAIAGGIKGFDNRIKSSALGYQRENMEGAGVSPEGMASMEGRLAQNNLVLYGDGGKNPGLIAEREAIKQGGAGNSPLDNPLLFKGIAEMRAKNRDEQIAAAEASNKELRPLYSAGMQKSQNFGMKLREVRANLPFQEAAYSAMNNTVYGGNGDLPAAIEKLHTVIESLDRSVRAGNINK